MVWIETPSNPMLNVVDIAAAAAAAHDVGAILVVDNTFATPYLQQPLSLGADVVVHSTTKYLGGHSDVIGGFAATNDPTIAERLYFLQKSLGAVPGPFDCWLVLRGVKTLAVRMRKHCENAHAIAAYLERHPLVERVLYPGLPTHPGHEIAARQMRDFGGMISILVGSEEEAVEIVGRTKLFQLAESLGGVESLIEHPARMTHASTADAPFAAPRNLIRLSVGIESAEDLIEDLELALVALARSRRRLSVREPAAGRRCSGGMKRLVLLTRSLRARSSVQRVGERPRPGDRHRAGARRPGWADRLRLRRRRPGRRNAVHGVRGERRLLPADLRTEPRPHEQDAAEGRPRPAVRRGVPGSRPERRDGDAPSVRVPLRERSGA